MKKKFSFFGLFVFLGLQPQHMEVPRLGVESELLAYTTAAAMPDPSHICDSHHSPWQHWILNPLKFPGPGTKPVSSWILVGFVTAEPQWELLGVVLCVNKANSRGSTLVWWSHIDP